MSQNPDASPHRSRAYQRLARHERNLWILSLGIAVAAAGTLALLTVAAATAGAFDDPNRGYVLGGACFLILGVFIAYMGSQREALEDSRRRLLEELESRSTALVLANRSLQEALKARDTFLDSVSHELKTPLTCMLATAELLAEEALDTETTRNCANGILEEGRGLDRLIGRLMDVTRFRTGTMKLRWAQAHLGRTLGSLVDSLREEAVTWGVGLSWQDPGVEGLEVWIDRERLTEAVRTLVQDSLRHAEPASSVRVSVGSVDADWLEILIEEESGRTAAPLHKALFEPFAALDPTPEGRSGDLGLALPLVRLFVTAHGGLIRVQDRDNQGVAYSILLPRRRLIEEPPSPVMEDEAAPAARAA